MDHSFLPTAASNLMTEKLNYSRFSIMPFCEEPAIGDDSDEKNKTGSVSATDMFNLFTADIIRMDALFVK